jgi:hypothetical protein
MYGGLFKIFAHKSQDPSLGWSDISFSAIRSLNTPMLKDGTCISEFLGGEEDAGESEFAAGVEARGGHTGGSTMSRRSLAVDQPYGTRAFLGGDVKRYACRRMVAARGAARFGGVIEMPKTRLF